MPCPRVAVGILSATEIHFTLSGIYSSPEEKIVTGEQSVRVSSSGIAFDWNGRIVTEIELTPTSADGDSFEIEGVTIGVNFHWERRETQRFRGGLLIKCHEGRLWAINLIPVEDYLVSVISSEMSAASSAALLRAHAVISRSWVISMLDKKSMPSRPDNKVDDNQIIKWWDREDHDIFDVCADDHCQRYQGTGRTTPAALDAVSDTKGIVLTDENGGICDTRFSKCCGGVFERFESCWADDPHSYLVPRRDWTDTMDFPDLSIEENAVKWIESSPDAFCNTTSGRILSQVLNSYDRESLDFYRWTVSYSKEELSALVAKRLGRNLGEISELIPEKRGTSGRIVRLRIVGTHGETTIGKELMIRRTLSKTHLRSSAFTVSKTAEGFTLHGAGWGHGVGLCQIGAAVMGERGFDWQAILSRYYPGSHLTKLY
ncbi:MAG: SpoIID/LytB domain-containing protein [Muribaculaceae bacterium]|nr:SpoIID/LytB domain-containing protein [Muribaculaceae bacterium]